MNKGGSQQVAGLTITMTDARHSSGFVDGGQMVYMGEPAGFVIRSRMGGRSTSPATRASSATCS